MRHKQGNVGVRPSDCRGLYDGAADVKSAVLSFIGKPKADKLRGSGQRPEALRYEPVGEEYHYLAVSQCPVSRRHCPLFCDFLDRKEHDLADRVIRGKNRLGFCEFAHYAVVGFHCVCGVD